jgi:renalase
MEFTESRLVAVVGGGIAGAAVAQELVLAGHAVHVFDKARGPGGRLATRRVEWLDQNGRACTTRFDHGAVGITARSASFQSFVDQAVQAGWLAEWAPLLAAGSLAIEDGDRFYLPTPDSPSLCRHLLAGAAATWSFAVDRLHRGPLGWQLQAAGERHSQWFDAVVLAMPPAQAAALLCPHRRDWARHASLAAMQPSWTLMGVADDPQPALGWDLTRPPTGPLAWLLRQDARPGRAQLPGQAHWVAHARAGWSRRHLEQPAEWIMQQLQGAVADWLGHPTHWQHCVVHRWRYALPQAARPVAAGLSWWDAGQGLGVCGDFLGGTGVEGAWLSARSLATALLLGGSSAGVGAASTIDIADPALDATPAAIPATNLATHRVSPKVAPEAAPEAFYPLVV